jgi:hypothetical protein
VQRLRQLLVIGARCGQDRRLGVAFGQAYSCGRSALSTLLPALPSMSSARAASRGNVRLKPVRRAVAFGSMLLAS